MIQDKDFDCFGFIAKIIDFIRYFIVNLSIKLIKVDIQCLLIVVSLYFIENLSKFHLCCCYNYHYHCFKVIIIVNRKATIDIHYFNLYFGYIMRIRSIALILKN
jgi:hypothetical protein